MGRFIATLQLMILLFISIFFCLFFVWFKPKVVFSAMKDLCLEWAYCINIFVDKSKEKEFSSLEIKNAFKSFYKSLNIKWSFVVKLLFSILAIIFVLSEIKSCAEESYDEKMMNKELNFIINSNKIFLEGDSVISLNKGYKNRQLKNNENILKFSYENIDYNFCSELFYYLITYNEKQVDINKKQLWTSIYFNENEILGRKNRKLSQSCKLKDKNKVTVLLNKEESKEKIKKYFIEKENARKIEKQKAEDYVNASLEVDLLVNNYIRYNNGLDKFPINQNPLNREVEFKNEGLKISYPKINKNICIKILDDQFARRSYRQRFKSFFIKWEKININNKHIINIDEDHLKNGFNDLNFKDLCEESNLISFEKYKKDESSQNNNI